MWLSIVFLLLGCILIVLPFLGLGKTNDGTTLEVIRAISGALSASASRRCKNWDHKKCQSIDYELSYSNRNSTTLFFGTPCFQEGKSHYSILE